MPCSGDPLSCWASVRTCMPQQPVVVGVVRTCSRRVTHMCAMLAGAQGALAVLWWLVVSSSLRMLQA